MTNRTAADLTATGDSLPKRAGHATITLTRGVDSWSVQTFQGPTHIEAWSYTYPTRDEARTAANHTRDAYLTYDTEQGIATARNALCIQRTQVEARLARSRDPQARAAYTATIEALDAQIAALTTLVDAANLPRLVADVTAFLADAA